jgi:GDPmannose 4,6-dehydratase
MHFAGEGLRPARVDTLPGDATKARRKLGWEPQATLEQLVEEMVRNDPTEAERHALCPQEGFNAFNQPK